VDGRGLKGILENLTYNGNSSTPIPFIPLHSTDSQTSPNGDGDERMDSGGCECGHDLHAGHLLTQNPHPASGTQQAEQASFTHEQIPKRASQFSLKINKRQSS
jgi:hypothetical protein